MCPKCKKELVRPVQFGKEVICWFCYRKVPHAEKVKAAQQEK